MQTRPTPSLLALFGAVACALWAGSAGAIPPRHRPRHRAVIASSPSPPAVAPVAASDAPRSFGNVPEGRLVRFSVTGDDAASVSQFVVQLRIALATMPEITILSPVEAADAPSASAAPRGRIGRVAAATRSGWRLGTVASGGRRTEFVVRPPRPMTNNDPLRVSRADYASGTLSLNIAVEVHDYQVGLPPPPGASGRSEGHTVEFVLASSGRSLFPRSLVRTRLERVAVPLHCGLVWH